jgi:gas vesicle protein
VSESRVVVAGAIAGALIGAAAGYLFFTHAGKGFRDRLEPAIDDLRREFDRFQKTLGRAAEFANEGVRMVNEFNAARGTSFPGSAGPH